jgi:hypothetical protein
MTRVGMAYPCICLPEGCAHCGMGQQHGAARQGAHVVCHGSVEGGWLGVTWRVLSGGLIVITSALISNNCCFSLQYGIILHDLNWYCM